MCYPILLKERRICTWRCLNLVGYLGLRRRRQWKRPPSPPKKNKKGFAFLKLNRVSLASFNFSNLGDFSEVEFLRIVSKLKQRKENLSSCVHVLRWSRVVEVNKIMYQKAWCTIRVSFRGNTVIWKRFFLGGGGAGAGAGLFRLKQMKIVLRERNRISLKAPHDTRRRGSG